MEFKKGSVLKRKIYGIYHHMGIYCNENQVYHFNKTGRSTSIVCTSLVDFAGGKKVSVHLEPEDDKHAEEIIKRAEAAFRNKKWDGNYSLLFLNCEDFVASCYGRGQYRRLSQQGKTVVALVGIALAVRKIAGKKIFSDKTAEDTAKESY